jgi:hypothetical protein
MRANVTRAAEGFDRRSFSVAEILRMQVAGVIAEDENFELIEGGIAPKQAKTHVHELLTSALWVVDAARRATFVHREPEGEGWRSIVERGPDEALIIPALPGFSMRLATV